MNRIGIESRIHGATVSNQADAVLLATSGASRESVELCDKLNATSHHEYASFAFFVNSTNRLCTFLHWQTGHVEFPGNGRYYTTRCVFEIPLQSFLQLNSDICGLVTALPEMRKTEKPDQSRTKDISFAPSQTDRKDEASVKMLSDAILVALNSKRQVFVKLDSSKEDYYADKVRIHPKMHQLLQALMALPPTLRWCCPFLFSADGDSSEFLLKDMVVVAYHEDTVIPPSDAILLDWTDDEVKCLTGFNTVDTAMVEQMAAIAPMIPRLINDSPLTLDNIWLTLSNAPKQIDQAISEGDNLNLLLTVYEMGKEMDGIYRHADVCCCLLQKIMNGEKIDNSDAIKSYIMNKYPEEARKIKAGKSKKTNAKSSIEDTAVKETDALNKEDNGEGAEGEEKEESQSLQDKMKAKIKQTIRLLYKYRTAFSGVVGILAGILIGVFIIAPNKKTPPLLTQVPSDDDPEITATDTATVAQALYIAQTDSLLPDTVKMVFGSNSIIFNRIDSVPKSFLPTDTLNTETDE